MTHSIIAQANDTSPTTQPNLSQWLDYIPASMRPWLVYALVVLATLLILRAVWRGITGAIRARRPAKIHPKLQKYNVDAAEVARRQEELAVQIIATSTGARLAGYRVAQQVDAVFVDGYKTPEEALTALKATAAERGANCILNVRTERTAAGKCSASGDAVLATPIPPKGMHRPPTNRSK